MNVSLFAYHVKLAAIGLRRDAWMSLLMCLSLAVGAQGRVLFPGLRLTVADVGVTLFVVALVGVPAKVFPAFQATRVPPSEVGRAL